MPDTTSLQLEALDTLFFKDGKPFSSGLGAKTAIGYGFFSPTPNP